MNAMLRRIWVTDLFGQTQRFWRMCPRAKPHIYASSNAALDVPEEKK